MAQPLNTPTATAFHQQATAATLPPGHRVETGGDSSTGRVSATVYDPSGKEVAHHRGSAAQVLADLEELQFPATDAFPALSHALAIESHEPAC